MATPKQYTTPSGAVVSETGQLISGPPTPAAQTPATPAPTVATPAAPGAPAVGTTPPAPSTTINVGTPAAPTTPTAQPKQPLAYDPTVNPSVIDLLNSTGADSSFEARKALADQYGIASYTGSKNQNVDLAKKYTAAYNKLKGTPMPETGAAADSALDTHFKDEAETIDNAEQKFFDSIGGMNPVVKNLYDQINQQLSSQNTRKTYEEEFAQAFADENIAAGIPGDSLSETQMKMLNLKNIMEGTEDDIRNEISNVGGFATESQVAALTGARNKTLMKQASFLQQSMALKQDYVDHLMQFSEKDRAQVEKDVDRKLGLTEKLVTLQDNMQNAAKENYQKIVSTVGYKGLISAIGNDPKQMELASKALGVTPAALKSLGTISTEKATEPKAFQFVSSTDNQQGGVFDPNTGKFTPRGGGGGGGGGGTGTGGVGTGIGGTVGTGTAPTSTDNLVFGSPEYVMAKVTESSKYGKVRLLQDERKSITAAKRALGSLELLKQINDGTLSKDTSQQEFGADTGVISGRIRTLKSIWGGDPSAAAVNATIQGLIPTVARGIFQEVGVLTDSDIKNYKKVVPDINKPENVNKLVELVLLKTLERTYADTLLTAAQNQTNVSEFAPEYKSVQSRLNALTGGGIGPGGGTIIVGGLRYKVDADGNYDENKPYFGDV